MAIAIEDVPLWAVHKGVGHAIDFVKNDWPHTACEMWGTFPQTKEPPKRICPKCRKLLQRASLSPSLSPRRVVKEPG
jgi:hypothetical protein